MAELSPTNVFMNCSFHGRDSTECGFSNLSRRSDYVALLDCNDMTNHLAACHLSRSALKEYEIILVRAGIFRWAESEEIKKMMVCPKHRDRYGKYWRSAATCQYPGHKTKGKSRAIKEGRNIHVINLKMATEIMDVYGVIVSIGSREF